MGVFLAPMAGVTDLSYRVLARENGADLVVSEMISAQAILHKNLKTLSMITIDPAERPVAIQLFGHDPGVMAMAARLVWESVQPDLIDLNFGCPTPKIIKNGDGAALLNSPATVGKIAEAVVRSVPVPVTAKIRLGWDQGSINCFEVTRYLEEAGVHWVTIHARTRDQFYAGTADWEWIRRVKEISHIPIVGNGDIFCGESARRLLEQSRCDHLAIGRGARGNPWIFRQIKDHLSGKAVTKLPDVEEKIAMALRHLRLKIRYDGEAKGVKEMRPHLAWYLKGIPHTAEIKQKINTTGCAEEMERLLKMLL